MTLYGTIFRTHFGLRVRYQNLGLRSGSLLTPQPIMNKPPIEIIQEIANHLSVVQYREFRTLTEDAAVLRQYHILNSPAINNFQKRAIILARNVSKSAEPYHLHSS
jgi:hypothetical protein